MWSDGGPALNDQSASEADAAVQMANVRPAIRLYDRFATVASIFEIEIFGRVKFESIGGQRRQQKADYRWRLKSSATLSATWRDRLKMKRSENVKQKQASISRFSSFAPQLGQTRRASDPCDERSIDSADCFWYANAALFLFSDNNRSHKYYARCVKFQTKKYMLSG